MFTSAQIRTLAMSRPMNPNLRGRSIPTRRDNETVGDALRNERAFRLEVEEWSRNHESSGLFPPREYNWH